MSGCVRGASNEVMEEKLFRQKVSQAMAVIQNALDKEDPDVIEAELSQGSLVITLSGKTKIILSQQPSVSQLWVAVASQGKAAHFEWSPNQEKWFDIKNPDENVYAYVEAAIFKATGLKFKFEA